MWAFIIIALCCLLVLLARRGRNCERAATGMLTSPLYLTASGLAVLLVGLTTWMAGRTNDVPAPWWILTGAMVLTILALRQALKWRYPYR
jgi:hypothetical protein